VGADCHGRCPGVVTGHVKSLRTCEWGDFVGAHLVGVGCVADHQRGRKLMTWEKDRNFETLDDILAYGTECVEDERENIIATLQQYKDRTIGDLGSFLPSYSDIEKGEAIARCIALVNELREDENSK
jgi:hypothetical protein